MYTDFSHFLHCYNKKCMTHRSKITPPQITAKLKQGDHRITFLDHPVHLSVFVVGTVGYQQSE